MSTFVDTKNIPPQILAPGNLASHDSSESWHVLPCSTLTVRASEKVQLRRIGSFIWAIDQGSTPPLIPQNGYKLPKFVVFWTTSTIHDETSAAKFHYIKTVSGKVVAQSIAFRVVSMRWQGDDPFPWNLGSKWPTPYWRQQVMTHFAL